MTPQPTPAEQLEIDAFQNGVYGAEPPEWWLNRDATTHRIEWFGSLQVHQPVRNAA